MTLTNALEQQQELNANLWFSSCVSLAASDFFLSISLFFFAVHLFVLFLSLSYVVHRWTKKEIESKKINILQSFYVNIPSKGCVFYQIIVSFLYFSFIYLFGRDTPHATGTFFFLFSSFSHPSPLSSPTHVVLVQKLSDGTLLLFSTHLLPSPPKRIHAHEAISRLFNRESNYGISVLFSLSLCLFFRAFFFFFFFFGSNSFCCDFWPKKKKKSHHRVFSLLVLFCRCFFSHSLSPPNY